MNLRFTPTAACLALLLLHHPLASASESGPSVPSPLGGNGHNVSFDGRLFIVTRGGSGGIGWYASVFRPERVSYDGGGYPVVTQAFSPFSLVQADANNENALAICEPDPARAPFRCDGAGAANASGDFDCYDLVIFDSDALSGPKVMRRRQLTVWVSNPGTQDAAIHQHQWTGAMANLSPTLRGIEPTVSADGRLMVFQGHPDNDGDIDVLMYTVNNTRCGLSGWTTPRVISRMNTDAATLNVWPLADRPLRSSDGQVFAPGDLVRGAYPWLFPAGDALLFTAANMPCRATEDPPGCGPRRNALSVLGYPTAWGISHIDGGVNPSVTDTVRLFFSSPGRDTFTQIPATVGLDVWPLFGSNTSNYAELILDDGLDGQYAGLWHMNEVVNRQGNLERNRTPDVSGYFNTGTLEGGASLPDANNGVVGKAVVLNGSGARIRVPHSSSLNPVNALTVALRLRPDSEPDCDGNNNYRNLLAKGNIATGAYTLVFEENRSFQARVKVNGQQYSLWSNHSIPVGAWSEVAFTYHGESGKMAFFVDGVETNAAFHAPGPLDGSSDDLYIGGRGGAAACPSGEGTFHGLIDDVAISRVVRLGAVPGPADAGVPEPDAGVAPDAEPLGEDASEASDAEPTPDTAVPSDAGEPRDAEPSMDAALAPDAEPTPDTGPATDAGVLLADAAGTDTGPSTPTGPGEDDGCSCRAAVGERGDSAGGLSGFALLILALAYSLARRGSVLHDLNQTVRTRKLHPDRAGR